MIVDGQPTDENAAEILRLFDQLQTAVNADDLNGTLAVTSPKMSPEDIHDQKALLVEALYSARYTGYRIDARAGLAKVAQSHGERGRVRMRAPFVNADEERDVDWFELRRTRGRWWFEWVGLLPPDQGDPMDLPPAERRQVIDTVAKCVEAFKRHDIGTLRYAYSKNRPYPSYEEQQAWMGEFVEMMELQFYSSSFVPEKALIEYFGPQKVQVPVYFSYKLPEADDTKERMLSAKFRFAKDDDGWGLVEIRARW